MLPFELFLLAGFAAATAQPLDNNSIKLSPWNSEQFSLMNGETLPHVVNQYQCFGGHLQRYPAQADWLSWKELWDINREQVLSINGGDTYLQHYIMEAILKVARESDVDPRYILAIIMQETKGYAAAPCESSVPRCGILSAPKGSTLDSSKPQDSIIQMIREGVVGSLKSGPGIAKLLSGKPAIANLPKGDPYAVARAYNSGSVGNNLDVVSHGQPRYVNDVANRLLGWDGTGKAFSQCQ